MLKKLLGQRKSLPIIAGIGGIITAIIIISKTPQPHSGDAAVAQKVDYVEAKVIPFRARSLGYGSVEPSTFLEANAEVSGRILYINPNLKRGSGISKGEVALTIDPTNYELALAKAEADLIVNQASLEELSLEKEKLAFSLDIAKRNLAIGEKELKRKKRLMKKGSVATSTVDAEEQKVLGLKQTAQELKTQVALLPNRKKVIQAQIARAKAQVNEQEKNLSRTKITLPFTGRIGEVFIEQGEFVAANSKLFNASDIARVEISAELPINKVRPIFLDAPPPDKNGTDDPALTKHLFERLKLEVNVRLVGSLNLETKWKARAMRIRETIDPTSRTVALIVAVDDPYGKSIPGQRPPLLKGMYTEVEFIAPPSPRLTIPRHAIHEGKVYVANEDDTLTIRM